MPTFTHVTIKEETGDGVVDATGDVDFEVFCGTCGEGLCGESDTRKSYRRAHNQVTVNACPNCMASLRETMQDEIDSLKARIEELKTQITCQ